MKKAILLILAAIAPVIVFAQTSSTNPNMGFSGLDSLIRSFANGVVRSTGYMMFTLAVVAFFWGIIKFIWSARNGADGKGATGGKSFMVWGLIALFVMFSVWGIVKFAQGVFGIQGDTTIIVPDLNFKGGSSGGVSPLSGSVTGNPVFNDCVANGGGIGECNNLSGRSSNNATPSGTSEKGGTGSGATSRAGGSSGGSGSGSSRTTTTTQVSNGGASGSSRGGGGSSSASNSSNRGSNNSSTNSNSATNSSSNSSTSSTIDTAKFDACINMGRGRGECEAVSQTVTTRSTTNSSAGGSQQNCDGIASEVQRSQCYANQSAGSTNSTTFNQTAYTDCINSGLDVGQCQAKATATTGSGSGFFSSIGNGLSSMWDSVTGVWKSITQPAVNKNSLYTCPDGITQVEPSDAKFCPSGDYGPDAAGPGYDATIPDTTGPEYSTDPYFSGDYGPDAAGPGYDATIPDTTGPEYNTTDPYE